MPVYVDGSGSGRIAAYNSETGESIVSRSLRRGSRYINSIELDAIELGIALGASEIYCDNLCAIAEGRKKFPSMPISFVSSRKNLAHKFTCDQK